jgi:hypothetical protein
MGILIKICTVHVKQYEHVSSGPHVYVAVSSMFTEGNRMENLAGNAENNDGIDGIGRNCVDLLSD